MRMGFYNSYTIWGGGEKWHFSAAEFMAKKGHEVFVLCDPDGELSQRVRATSNLAPVDIKVNKHSYWNPFALLKTYSTLKKLKLDALIFNAPHDVRNVAFIARQLGIKKIIYRDGMPVPIPEKKSTILAFQKGLTHIVSISKENRRILQEKTPCLSAGHEIKILTNAFDFSLVPEKQPDQKTDQAPRPLTLVTTGRLSEQKGQIYLLEACALLKSRGHQFILNMIGDGELKEQMVQKVKELGLEDRVHFLGFQKNVYEHLLASDIFVFPSLWEGTASSIIEAQACGLPVVCFEISSMPEMVEHQVTGLLSRPKDSEDFALKIEELIISKELREKLGAQAKKNVIDNFNVEKIYNAWEEFIRT